MKRKINVKNIGRVFGIAALLAMTMVVSAFAATITKPFEIGEGTAFGRSNFRSFTVPCGLSVSAAVKYRRKGSTVATSDVPITVELVKPGASADEEGTLAQSKNVTAKTTEQQVNLSGGESVRGCAAPWRVRVKHTNEGNSPLAVYGDITVTFNDNQRTLTVQDAGSINLNSANTVTVNVGNSSGLEQGNIVINGEWFHNLGLMPIKMRFELLDPDGRVVTSASGFPTNAVAGDKLRLTFNVTECKSGQWKLRIKNISDGHDAIRVKPFAKHQPDCPN